MFKSSIALMISQNNRFRSALDYVSFNNTRVALKHPDITADARGTCDHEITSVHLAASGGVALST